MKKQLTALLNDKNFCADNVVESREGIKNIENSSLGAIVKTLCWSINNKVKNQNEYITKQVRELKTLTESTYAGSDTHTFSVERKLEFIGHLQTTQDELEDFLDGLQKVHKDNFGTAYQPPIKATKNIETAANLEAQQLLAKFNI